jgi:hypothetical protein
MGLAGRCPTLRIVHETTGLISERAFGPMVRCREACEE